VTLSLSVVANLSTPRPSSPSRIANTLLFFASYPLNISTIDLGARGPIVVIQLAAANHGHDVRHTSHPLRPLLLLSHLPCAISFVSPIFLLGVIVLSLSLVLVRAVDQIQIGLARLESRFPRADEDSICCHCRSPLLL